MKLFKIALIFLVLLVNFSIVRPSLADAPKLEDNRDYQLLTQTLDNYLDARTADRLPEGFTSTDQLQQQIAQLQYQKYIIENSQGYSECRNETGKTLAIYGPKGKKSTSTFDNELYLLPDGATTDEDWSCQGLYLPNDVQVAGLTSGSAGAVKILDGTRLVIGAAPETGMLTLNLPPAEIYKSGEINWEIPDLAEADLNRQLPTAPTD